MIFEAKVKTNSADFSISKTDSGIVITVKSQPKEGKANQEIVKELAKLAGSKVSIIKGLKSKKKTISIDAPKEVLEKFL